VDDIVTRGSSFAWYNTVVPQMRPFFKMCSIMYYGKANQYILLGLCFDKSQEKMNGWPIYAGAVE